MEPIQLKLPTHQWGNWSVTTAATCTTEGIETRACSLDGTVETRVVPISPEAHDWQLAPTAIAPTCTEDGNGDQICSHNPEHTKIGVIPALGHDFGDWLETIAPTCTTEGLKTGTCNHDLSHKETEVIPTDSEAHDWAEWTIKASVSLTEDGEETRICNFNVSHFETNILPALNKSIAGVTAYLSGQSGGNNINDPIQLPIQINLGNTGSTSDWDVLLTALGTIGKYVDLDLTASVITGNRFGFNAGSIFNTGTPNAGRLYVVSVSLPSTVTATNSFAFSGFANLKSFTAGNITNIATYSFYQCSSLELTKLPSGITRINSYAFAGCTSLALTELPPLLEVIEGYAFSACTSLSLTTFPSSLYFMNTGAFSTCTSLNSIELLADDPDRYYAIWDVFYGCTNLTEVILHATVPPILGPSTFTYTHATLVIKVPNASVVAYQTAENWSAHASRIISMD